METGDIPISGPSDWQPMTDKHDVAVLGKLGEESSELASAIFRCIIQGLDEREPVTGKLNRDWLRDEIADVMALAHTAIVRLGLDATAINDRRARKIAYKKPWFDGLSRQRD